MKRINYIGRDLLTGDRIADAIMEYATVLARRARADRVDIPVLIDDRVSHVEVILGPASQLMVESVQDGREEPVDDALVADLEQRAGRLRDPRPMAVPEGSSVELSDDWLK
jgi:hypothetical protein